MGSDRSRDEMPRSELGVWVAVVSAAHRALAGLHEDAFHGLPQAVLAGSRHGVHLHLTVDGPPVLLPSHRQQRISGLVPEAHGLLAPPHGPPTLNHPFVQVVAFTFIAKRAYFLWTGRKFV